MFSCSKRMYTQRLRDWDVAKNIGSHDVREYLERLTRLGESTPPDGASSIMLRGKMVTRRKLLNHLKRRHTAHKAQPDEAEVPEEDSVQHAPPASTGNVPSEDNDDCLEGLVWSVGEEPYQDFESALENEEMPDGLTSEGLTSLSIAMLQTDFHYRQNDEDAPPRTHGRTEKEDRYPSTTLSPPQSLAGSEELCDLEFVLHNSNVAYARFPNTRQQPSPEPPQLSARQQGQAKDFYARHWLAISLLSKCGIEKPDVTAFKLLGQTQEQVGPMVLENHPHLLPWIAFVVCYPGNFKYSKPIQHMSLNATLAMSGALLPKNDPRRQIQQRLASSKFRKSICLVMLRQVISFFRRETQQSHLDALDLLARLFDTIEVHGEFGGDVVEETLRRWAETSLSIANVIEQDQRTARMKAERNIFDPVRQAAASNINPK